MKGSFLTVFITWVYVSFALAQVTTNPAFPTDDQGVTITFDATQGNQGLKDCGCDVYAHTGVITDKSTGLKDWKYVKGSWGTDDVARKMTPLGNNKYSLTLPNIRSYYGVPAGEKILKMAFVFRNLNGSKAGRATDGSDLYADVYAAGTTLLIQFVEPTAKNLIVEQGQNLKIQFNSNKTANLTLLQDGNVVSSNPNATSLTATIMSGSASEHTITAKAKVGSDSSSASFKYIVPKAVITEALPSGSLLGVNKLSATQLRFVLEAPQKSRAFVVGDFSNWLLSNDFMMKKTPDNRYFWLDINNLKPGQAIKYQYLVDGITIADPLSEMILDPDNDKYIAADVFPDMPTYPTNLTTGHVSVITPGAAQFQWQNTLTKAPKEQLVIYELLLRDFLKKHDYQSLKDTLDYLQRLGVNAIQLMPVNEFEGNISWGYNPSYHAALDKYYGTPERFKLFIDEAHRRGIAIILDVVFNHAFGQSPLCRLYWDNAASKPTTSNPWLNPDAKHPFNVGYDFNHESNSTKDYVIRCLNYWLTEYKIDGFRFDLSKGFTQKFSTDDSNFAKYDASRVAILKKYADEIWKTVPSAYVILEHFAENIEEIELSNYGMMLWGNLNYQYNEATMGYVSDLGWGIYKNRSWTKPHLVTYMESHDEERLNYKNIQYGNSSGSYNVKQPATALKRMALASNLFYTIPGPKMIWQFGELGLDFSLFTCEDGVTVNSNCKLSPKPIRWEYLNDANRRALYNVNADLIYLKKTLSVFNTTDFTANVNGRYKWLVLRSTSQNAVALSNFDVNENQQTITFPKTGTWYDFYSGDSITINSTSQAISLTPGEYRLYLDSKVARPSKNFPSSNNEITDFSKIEFDIFPNPASDLLTISLKNGNTLSNPIISLFDSMGKRIKQYKIMEGDDLTFSLEQLNNGIYFLQLSDKQHIVKTQKLVVMR